jgi:hypothetical protein
MVIVTYDEFGGQWDHVSPPGQGGAPGPHDQWGPGTRIPALIVAPQLRGDFVVDHTNYDTTSVLATIEQRFGLDPVATRDAQVNSLANAFEQHGVNGDSTPVDGGVSGTVPATLSLALGAPASFGPFTPGTTKTYEASTSATITSTAGVATLSVADPSPNATGHLVNGAFSLPQPLQARARNAANSGTAYNNVGSSASPLNLLTYSGPVSNDQVALQFSQLINATDPLRTGTYSKTLTFTLSTTTP